MKIKYVGELPKEVFYIKPNYYPEPKKDFYDNSCDRNEIKNYSILKGYLMAEHVYYKTEINTAAEKEADKIYELSIHKRYDILPEEEYKPTYNIYHYFGLTNGYQVKMIFDTSAEAQEFYDNNKDIIDDWGDSIFQNLI